MLRRQSELSPRPVSPLSASRLSTTSLPCAAFNAPRHPVVGTDSYLSSENTTRCQAGGPQRYHAGLRPLDHRRLSAVNTTRNIQQKMQESHKKSVRKIYRSYRRMFHLVVSAVRLSVHSALRVGITHSAQLPLDQPRPYAVS
jgi:hypothetical protein